MCNHTQAEHDAMKTDEAWAALAPIGFQPGDDVNGDLEMRNAECGSTLCRRCMLTPEQRAEIRAASVKRSETFRRQVQDAMARQVAA